MADAGTLIKETESATFGPDVITESQTQPVLVEFWAPGNDNCKLLNPVLERVVKRAKGRIKLVRMNVEAYPQIPARLGVRSLPAVIAFQRAQPLDGFMGAVPETQIHTFIERLVGPIEAAVDPMIEAEGLLEAGDPTGAAEIFASIIREDPSAFKALAGLIRAFTAAGEIAAAKRIAASVPAAGERDPTVIAAKAALELAEQAAAVGDFADLHKKLAADPADHQARFDLAIALNGAGQRDAAAEHLLEIIKQDRNWNEDGARKQLLQFFDAWGLMDAATLAARRKLSGLMFS